ncbi:MAG: hypothetical protein NTW21_32490 [Verrucomicrobia bacterium]|nr:hypothetical protein [Verrucomicrobiota bacterium]
MVKPATGFRQPRGQWVCLRLDSRQSWVALTKDAKRTEALWFFDDGKHQFISPVEYWLATSRRRATLGRSGAEPVLVSLRSLPDEPIHWDRVRQILLPALGFH